MTRRHWTRDLVFAIALLLPVTVLVARIFVGSWTRALGWSVVLAAGLLVLSLSSRRANARRLDRRYGRIVVRGPTLTFEEQPGELSSVPAAAMRELWYRYNRYGWSSANSWLLVHEVGSTRGDTSIYESGGDHLIEPLRSWCVRHLPGFDRATFDRLAGSLGDEDEADVLVWSSLDESVGSPQPHPGRKD